MAMLKRLLLYVLGGAVLGTVVSSLIAPAFLVSQNTTMTVGAQCDCAKVTRDTASALIQWQLVGAAAGAAVLLIIGIIVSVKGRKPAGGTVDTSSGNTTGGSGSSTPPPVTPP